MYYGYSPFYRNTSIESVIFTDIPTEVFTNEFYGCISLKHVSIGDGVKKIGAYAFSGCSALNSFSFGANVQEIGAEAFSDCIAMTRLYAEPITPPICDTQALDDINKWECTLYVASDDAKALYLAADQWKEFFFVDLVDFSKEVNEVDIYDGSTVAVTARNPEEALAIASCQNALFFTHDASASEMRNFVIDGHAASITLTDTQPFYSPPCVTADKVTYTHNVETTSWLPLYIPFTLKEEEWKDKVLVSDINNIHQYDFDDDGNVDKTVLEFISKKHGDILPNTPYLIKPLQTGETTLTAENTTLYATPEVDSYVDCASTKSIFKIAGTYQEKSGLGDNVYGFADGKFVKLEIEDCVKPFGVYLTMTERCSSNGLLNAPRRNNGYNPQEIHISIDGEEVTNEVFELAEGWNWVSSNISGIKDAMAFIAPVKDYVSRFVSQTEELVNDPVYGLVGNLKAIDPTKAYKLCMKNDTRLSLTATVYDPSFVPVVLEKGWNWLGFTPNEAMTVAEALQKLNASEGDQIKGMDGFATYSDGKWTGDLALLEPANGYMYHSAGTKAFLYPEHSFNNNTLEAAKARRQEVELPWTADKHRYADNATVIACLVSGDKEVGDGDGWYVGAFVEDECRGTGKWIDNRLFITIHGEAKDASICFRAVNIAAQEEREIQETIMFSDDRVGTMANPLALHLSAETTSIASTVNADNYIEVYNLEGVIVYRGKKAGIPEYLKGLYIIKCGDKSIKCSL